MIKESGFSYSWETWFGLLVSSKTPRSIVAKLHTDITRARSENTARVTTGLIRDKLSAVLEKP